MYTGILSIEQLIGEIDADRIDTVVIAMPDGWGRLQGKRLDASHFRNDVVSSGLSICSYLLTRDVDMEVMEGFQFGAMDSGVGDFTLVPDLSTLRVIPWMPGAALVIADPKWADRSPVSQAPRQVLRTQLERLKERGWTARVATELEFLYFENSYREAWNRQYRGLTPATYNNSDYSIVGTSSAEPFMRQVRRHMRDAGLSVEGITGECNLGQFELGFKHDEAMRTADHHVIYKEGIKEIALQNGTSVTFMPKFDEGAGNSCHIHLSLFDESGNPVFAQGEGTSRSRTMDHFIAGQISAARELSVFYAPTVNAYKRFGGEFAPGSLTWGYDNRTTAFRVLGFGHSLRIENRLPGGDANPYLAIAAVIAAGLHGVENKLELTTEATGNAYHSGGESMPRSLAEAAELLECSQIAENAFGVDVAHHFAHSSHIEADHFRTVVTDWERIRGFERL